MTRLFLSMLFLVPTLVSAQNESRRNAGSQEADQAIAITDSGVQRLIVWLDQIDSQLSAELQGKGAMGVQTSNLNLSKSNVNRTKGGANTVSTTLERLKHSDPRVRNAVVAELHETAKGLEGQVNELYLSLMNLGSNYSTHGTELRKRHDTVKSAINNIR